jgi:hypothetical protein
MPCFMHEKVCLHYDIAEILWFLKRRLKCEKFSVMATANMAL